MERAAEGSPRGLRSLCNIPEGTPLALVMYDDSLSGMDRPSARGVKRRTPRSQTDREEDEEDGADEDEGDGSEGAAAHPGSPAHTFECRKQHALVRVGSERGSYRQITVEDWARAARLSRCTAAVALSHAHAPFALSKRMAARLGETHAEWLRACVERARALDPAPAVFAYVHVGAGPRAQRALIDSAAALGVAGFAVGGVFSGESAEERAPALRAMWDALPEGLPRWLLNVSAVDDVLALRRTLRGLRWLSGGAAERAAQRGVAVLPPADGVGDVRSLDCRDRTNLLSAGPLASGCACYACRNHSLGYVCHLHLVHELLGTMLLHGHNRGQLLRALGYERPS